LHSPPYLVFKTSLHWVKYFVCVSLLKKSHFNISLQSFPKLFIQRLFLLWVYIFIPTYNPLKACANYLNVVFIIMIYKMHAFFLISVIIHVSIFPFHLLLFFIVWALFQPFDVEVMAIRIINYLLSKFD
jgi:hypothetical protein